MSRIPVWRGGNIVAHALVDDIDVMLVQDKRWRLSAQGYAMNGARGRLMHRVVLSAPGGLQVDHINGDKLDNRRSNLRLVTAQEQTENRCVRADSTTGSRGVFLAKDGRYYVQVRKGGVVHHGGRHATLGEAREAAVRLRAHVYTHHNEDRSE